jgi:hypothetical protein
LFFARARCDRCHSARNSWQAALTFELLREVQKKRPLVEAEKQVLMATYVEMKRWECLLADDMLKASFSHRDKITVGRKDGPWRVWHRIPS